MRKPFDTLEIEIVFEIEDHNTLSAEFELIISNEPEIKNLHIWVIANEDFPVNFILNLDSNMENIDFDSGNQISSFGIKTEGKMIVIDSLEVKAKKCNVEGNVEIKNLFLVQD